MEFLGSVPRFRQQTPLKGGISGSQVYANPPAAVTSCFQESHYTILGARPNRLADKGAARRTRGIGKGPAAAPRSTGSSGRREPPRPSASSAASPLTAHPDDRTGPAWCPGSAGAARGGAGFSHGSASLPAAAYLAHKVGTVLTANDRNRAADRAADRRESRRGLFIDLGPEFGNRLRSELLKRLKCPAKSNKRVSHLKPPKNQSRRHQKLKTHAMPDSHQCLCPPHEQIRPDENQKRVVRMLLASQSLMI